MDNKIDNKINNKIDNKIAKKIDNGQIINWISMISVIIAGLIFIWEGLRLISIKKKNPKMPKKIYALAVICLIVGIFDIVVGILHIFFK